MEEGKTYFLRVKHTGTKYGSSNWSNVIRVSTLVPYTPIANSTGKSISQANGNYSARAGFTIYNNVLYVPRWVRDTGLYVSHGIFPQRWQGAWSARIFDDIPAGSYLIFVPVDTRRIRSITISWYTKYYDFTNLAVHVVRNGGCGWGASFTMYLYSKEDVLLDYYNVGVSAWC